MKTREEAVEYLKGKTIKDIMHGSYLGWFTIHEIRFTDGTVVELAGNADEARIDSIVKPDGEQMRVDVEFKDGENASRHGLTVGAEQTCDINDLLNLEGVKGRHGDLNGSYRVASVDKDEFTIERNE